MKKLIAFLLAVLCVFSVSSAVFAKPGDLIGDVNGDGVINARDYARLKRYCLKTLDLTDEELERSDVNDDGKVNARDYAQIKRHCLKTYTITGVVGGGTDDPDPTPDPDPDPGVDPATCNHNVKTLRGAYAPTETTDGYFGDLYCVYCNTKLFTGSYYSYNDYVYSFDFPNGGTVRAPLSVNIIEYTLALAGKKIECSHSYIEEEILRLCNIEREKVGLHPLKMMDNAHYFSTIRAVDCFDLFSHTRPNGDSWDEVYREANIILSCTWGENLVYIGSSSTQTDQYVAERFVELWMNSEGHRANILDPDYDYMSVAVESQWNEELGMYQYTGVQHFFGWFDE